MENRLFVLKEAILHYLLANTTYQVHSPSLYYTIENMIEKRASNPKIEAIETIRKKLLIDGGKIGFEELGAYRQGRGHKTIREIARTSLTPFFQCEWLYNLVQTVNPRSILELGTSLGLTTAYLSLATNAKVTTVDGNAAVMEWAFRHWGKLDINHINAITGKFDDVLVSLLEKDSFDLVFVDGNHTYKSTINYFGLLSGKTTKQSIIIFHDIHWSPGMKKAWRRIISDEKVRASVDLFYMGLIFYDPSILQKVDLKLVPVRWKPWRQIF